MTAPGKMGGRWILAHSVRLVEGVEEPVGIEKNSARDVALALCEFDASYMSTDGKSATERP